VPSEAALVIAQLVSDRHVFPDQAAQDLARLLGHTIAEPDPASRRWDLLGALVAVMRQLEGALPTAREYDAIRRKLTEDAPAASSLTERYGSWLVALDQASRLMTLGLRNPVRLHRHSYHRPYTPNECLAALAQFRKRFGDWPRATEYMQWSRSSRRVARECGARDPLTPELAALIRRFGTFDRALEAARAVYGGGG
jgi:hypothetical protein